MIVATEKHLRYALRYAELGWPVLPLHTIGQGRRCTCGRAECKSPGKHPLTQSGLNDATIDPNEIANHWASRSDANIGVRTGEVSGFWALDIDGEEGERSLVELQDRHGPLPVTRTSITGGGGRHLLFGWPDEPIRNFNDGRIGPGLDVRADGGYIVVAPSLHASGQEYNWEKPAAEIAEAPDWLLELVRPRRARVSVSAPKPESLDIAAGEKLTQGQRHNALVSFAGRLRHAGLVEPEILAGLEAFNQSRCQPPKERDELERIARDAAGWESGEPQWPVLEPLPAESPVMPCDLEMLPAVIAEWAQDLAELASVPVDFAVAGAIVCLSAAIGRRARIQPKRYDTRFIVVPNLWGVFIAEPGSKKSFVLSQAKEPLEEIEREWLREYEAAMVKYEASMAAFKHADGNRADGDESERPVMPVRRRAVLNDATAESLHKDLTGSPGGVLFARDELSGWMGSLEKPGREGDRGFWLETWNGDGSYRSSRISRGSTDAEGLCVSILGGMQPGPWMSYADSAPEDGLLPRFQLLVWPDPLPEVRNVDRAPNQIAAERYASTVRSLAKLDPAKPRLLRFDREGQLLYEDWAQHLEEHIKAAAVDGHAAFANHVAKYRSLMPSLACIFELAEDEHAASIRLDATRRAAAFCEYLDSHARRSHNARTESSLSGARTLAAKIKTGAIGKEGAFTLRDVYKSGWSGLSTREAARAACDVLTEYGWVRRIEPRSGKPGRPRESFEINPEVDK